MKENTERIHIVKGNIKLPLEFGIRPHLILYTVHLI